MKVINVNISKLIPYENNPRINKKAIKPVAQSIKEFGFQVPIVIDSNNVIVAGHTRYEASKQLKLTEVPCVVADNLSEEQIKAFRLADNKTAEFSMWDFDLLKSELNDILDIDMTDFGFDLDGIEEESEVVEVEAPEPPEEPKSKLGDIWQLGRHRLMCGDSTDPLMVNLLMNGERADMVITDPPYNVSYEGKTKDALTIQNDSMKDEEFKEFLTKAFNNMKDAMKDGAAYYIWFSDVETYNFTASIKSVGLKFTQMLIWEKNNLVMGRKDYQFKHEPCLYGWKDGASHNWYSDRCQTTILKYNKPTKSDLHPTMKPIGLFDYEIKNSSKQGNIVLDLFGGSGTTIIACEQNNRAAYSMEYDPKYCDVIIERWEKYTGSKAVLLNGSES